MLEIVTRERKGHSHIGAIRHRYSVCKKPGGRVSLEEVSTSQNRTEQNALLPVINNLRYYYNVVVVVVIFMRPHIISHSHR